MAIGSKVSGDFKSASNLYAKVNGGWKKAQFGYVKVAGEWKQFWAAELIDAFSRTDTQSGLGTAPSGQAWTTLRSQWQINGNAAKTTGTKTDYPLAVVDTGFISFNLEANELEPGMGVALRVTDANNWWAVVPYYTQTATPYSYCVTSVTESYCIRSEPAGYNNEVCFGTEVDYGDYYTDDCCTSVEITDIVQTGTVCDPPYVERICSTTQVCTTPCIKYCSNYSGSFCCDRDYVCNDVTTCRNKSFPGECYPIYEEVISYECTSSCQVYIPDVRCEPNGYTLVPAYVCVQSGTRQVCTQSATGVNYTNYYNIRVIKMVNGVVSVVADTAVSERWNALKITGDVNNLTVTAYKDSLYTQVVGSYQTNTFTISGTGFGVVGAPSLFEDGRTIGSITVKPLGQ